jgi:hypothetical protein
VAWREEISYCSCHTQFDFDRHFIKNAFSRYRVCSLKIWDGVALREQRTVVAVRILIAAILAVLTIGLRTAPRNTDPLHEDQTWPKP